MYAAFGSKPDIAFSVAAVSRYNVQPLEIHLTTTRRVLRYLKMTSELHIHYRRLPYSHANYSHVHNSPISVVDFMDSDWAGNLTTRKLIRGSVFGLRYIDDNIKLVTSGLIHWQAKSQSVLALSTLEAEYIAGSHATRVSLWLNA